MNILHIAPHMGGGVGKVIAGLAAGSDGTLHHTIVLFEQPVKQQFVNKAQDSGTQVLICPSDFAMGKLLQQCDIVIVHWWHHPKTAQFLYKLPSIPLRLIIWSHISNLTVPALNPHFLLEATRVIFTTEASFAAPVFADIPQEILCQKAGLVYGCSGFDDFPEIKREAHMGFHIGYLGYIDYAKLHPDFIDFCQAVAIPEAVFILAGDAPARYDIEQKAAERQLKNKFAFLDYVEDIHAVLAQFDVFGYPLMPYHTCTTENAILEAMAAEVPPVVLDQLTEKYIIKDGETGMVVSGIEEYGSAIRYLYQNLDIRRRMGHNAREYVLNHYTKKRLGDSFYRNCQQAIELPKQILDFRKHMGDTPAKWFLSCLGDNAPMLRLLMSNQQPAKDMWSVLRHISPLLKQPNKSSIPHYQKEFPYDPNLRVWREMISGGNSMQTVLKGE